MHTKQIATPLGPMVATADDQRLLSLSFCSPADPFVVTPRYASHSGQGSIESCLPTAPNTTASRPVGEQPYERTHKVFSLLEAELQAYFAGTLKVFTTPLKFTGTPFQNRVWEKLQQIPLGKTCSYKELAQAIGKPTASRAVALANRANPFAIIVPCHRVIRANGDLCGYNGGIEIKKWLLGHEQAPEH